MFPMGNLEAFTVKRAAQVQDPYNPETTVEDWANPETFTVYGFIATTNSTETGETNRAGLVETATVTIPDCHAEVLRGDILTGEDGRRWQVQGHPKRDRNPFTGWEPTTVCNVTAWQG